MWEGRHGLRNRGDKAQSRPERAVLKRKHNFQEGDVSSTISAAAGEKGRW